jgi:hypothetical protein
MDSSAPLPTSQTDNNSVIEEIKELRLKFSEQQERCRELIEKVDPTCVQEVEKPLGKSKISINTVFNLNRKEGQVRRVKSFFGDLIRKSKVPLDTTYRTLDVLLAENWIEAVSINF